MLIVLVIFQVLIALGLILLTAFTTTKSEQGGTGGIGWGTLGGKASSSIAGLEDQLGRITTWLAVAFLAVSALVGMWAARTGLG
jgi:preprotein translocase subunit SecG